jgi:8-oxo-dGTP pyrophosphatase MutT (NUDIX family)
MAGPGSGAAPQPVPRPAGAEPGVPPQKIPRPPGAEPGPPAPWVSLPSGRRSGFTIDRVRAALTTPFDPDARPGRPEDGEPRQSSVLAALFDEAGEARMVLTRRASHLRNHRSEVSFPGGAVDPGETLVGAALREAWEEVGLAPDSVEVIGMLSPIVTFSSRALINPFVGLLPARPSLQANPAEVERAFDVSLSDLLLTGVHRSERWHFGGEPRDMYFFELPGDIVWGATARLIWELLLRVTGSAPDTEAEIATLT